MIKTNILYRKCKKDIYFDKCEIDRSFQNYKIWIYRNSNFM